MRQYLGIIGVTAVALAAVYYFMPHEMSSQKRDLLASQLKTSRPTLGSTESLRTTMKSMVKKIPLDQTTTTYTGGRRDIQDKVQRTYGSDVTKRAAAYFDKMLNDDQIKALYAKSQRLMGATQEGEGAARWMTMGGIFSSSDGYGDALNIALKDANSNPSAVLDQMKKEASQFREDPFLYQMAMNMTYQLNLDPKDRGEFFGQEIEYQMQNSADSRTDSFWVALMGVTLAKQAGVPAETLEPYLQRALGHFRGSEKLMAEVKQTVSFHYPEIRF